MEIANTRDEASSYIPQTQFAKNPSPENTITCIQLISGISVNMDKSEIILSGDMEQ